MLEAVQNFDIPLQALGHKSQIFASIFFVAPKYNKYSKKVFFKKSQFQKYLRPFL